MKRLFARSAVMLISASILMVAGGCREAVPVQAGVLTDAQVLAAVRSRDAKISTFSNAGTVLLTRADGKHVAMDAVLVGARPGLLRLRSYKMGSAVFDLTLLPDATWMWQSRRAGREPLDLPTFDANAVPIWRMLIGSLPEAEGRVLISSNGRLDWEAATGAGRIIVTIDRATATVQQYRFIAGDGSEHHIQLGEYFLVDDIAWPGRIAIASDRGRIEIKVSDAEVNPQLPDGAFTPVDGATRLGNGR